MTERSQLRSGALIPADNRTHVLRINDWVGSNSYVEGCRRDPEDIPEMPKSEMLPYRLLSNAIDYAGRLRRAGEIVEIHPEHAGEHHAKIAGVEYPDAQDG